MNKNLDDKYPASHPNDQRDPLTLRYIEEYVQELALLREMTGIPDIHEASLLEFMALNDVEQAQRHAERARFLARRAFSREDTA